jgi:hypothetical protein
MASRTPSTVYRVYDDTSMSKYHAQEGFRAKYQGFTSQDWEDRRKMASTIPQHLDWYNRASTPFILTSASHKTTLREAERRIEHGYTHVRVSIIDFDLLASRTKVDNVKTLVEKFLIELPRRLEQFIGSAEYLCLRSIPVDVIRRDCSMDEFREHCEERGNPNMCRELNLSRDRRFGATNWSKTSRG